MRYLYAGPWVGEFGWEIMGWQGHLRKVASEGAFDEVVIACRPDSRPLYADFATRFMDVKPGLLTDQAKCKDQPNQEVVEQIKREVGNLERSGAEVVQIPPARHGPEGQKFVQYGEKCSTWRADLVIHNRTARKWRTENRTYQHWEKVLKWLPSEWRVVTIGNLQESGPVPGILEDFRGVHLSTTMDVLRNSKCLCGPSSGPIHLGALCECPTVVWTDTGHRCMGMSNAERLREKWNPFGTRVTIAHGWQPDPEQIAEAIRELHDESG